MDALGAGGNLGGGRFDLARAARHRMPVHPDLGDFAPGGLITIYGAGFVQSGSTPSVQINGTDAFVVAAFPFQVNAQIPYDDPKIATLTGLWHAADFLEREMWDLMGVEYTGHPNLTRILLPEDFKFHPLRKEFAQEVDRQYITRRKLRGGK